MTAVFSDIVGRYVHLTVQDVAYRVSFEQAGQGVPVLLQNTAGSDGRQWRHLLEDPDLTARFSFVAYDLPFHGKSLPPTGKPWWSERYSLSQSFLIDFVAAMAAALAMEGGIYIGCSMGGHLAPDLALLRPGLFRAVIAVEGGLATHDPEPFLDYLSHPRASNEVKAGLMLSQMSRSVPSRSAGRRRGSTARAVRRSFGAISITTSESTTSHRVRLTSIRRKPRCMS
jgi:pimeloyl-ACP methyl ester carboxylesterase